MISRNKMDRLAGALMLNRDFREAFVENKLNAIQTFNCQQSLRLAKPLDFTDEELGLIMSLPAKPLQKFIAALENYITERGLVLLV